VPISAAPCAAWHRDGRTDMGKNHTVKPMPLLPSTRAASTAAKISPTPLVHLVGETNVVDLRWLLVDYLVPG